MYVKRTSKPKSKTAVKRTYKKKSSTVSRTVKSYVEKAIKKNVEIMFSDNVEYNQIQLNTFNTATTTLPTVLNLTAPLGKIQQGSGQSSRSGNQITLSSMPLKMIFRDPNGYVGTTASELNLAVKFVIAKLKNTLSEPTTSDFEKIHQAGNASSAPVNSYVDIITPFNRDYWTIKKTFNFKLSKISNAESNLSPLSGHGFLKVISVDLAKYLPKTIKYDDIVGSGDEVPTNCGLYGFIIAGDTLGTTTDFNYIKASYSTWARYTDE